MSRVSKKITKSMRQNRSTAEKMMNALEAYRKGFRVKKFGLNDIPEFRFNKYGGKK